MADINLLPEEFRNKDAKAREEAKKKPTKVELNLTKPEKSKDITTKKGFWKKILPGGKEVHVPEHLDATGLKNEPAKQKNESIKKPPTGGVHMPKFAKESPPDPIKLDVDDVADEPIPQKSGLVNPHMSDFQNDSSKSEDELAVEALHEPETDEAKAPEKKPELETAPGAPQITIEEEVDKKPPLINRVASGVMKVIYRITRRESSHEISVNLMPERRISLRDVNWSRIVRMLVVSIGGAAGITVIWYLVLLDQERQGQQEFSELQNEIALLQGTILQLRDEQSEALLLKNKLDIAGTLIDNHIYWTQFLEFLESATLDGVFYDGLSANIGDESAIVLSGTADTLETVFWQRETLTEHEGVVSVEVVSATPVETSIDNEVIENVTFSLNLVVEDKVWKK